MSKRKDNLELYALWLPLTAFHELGSSFFKVGCLEKALPNSNRNWSWISFTHNGAKFTIDSLGFVFIDYVKDKEHLNEMLAFVVQHLNLKSKQIIFDTFLNKNLVELDALHKDDEHLFEFLKHIAIAFPSIDEHLKLEHIDFNLLMNKEKIAHNEKFKFSLQKSNEDASKNFYTILNRNLENLLKKSLFFTHGLTLEKGERYRLSVVENIYETIEASLPQLELKIDGKLQTNDATLMKKVIEKVIQDTIEERVILNFLERTKINYLSKIIHEISINNETLKKLNSYLLEDIQRETQENIRRQKDLDDESATEIFVQNLLQVTPKFYRIDAKLQEAYYIKVGNTTTNLSMKDDETITNTLHYTKWKASIDFCIETAKKAKESLDMYHQNKTLKELEDISYNANYQADIEDIRELKKNKAFALDESSKRILFFIAIVTLAGEAPILEFNNNPSIWLNAALNLGAIIGNFLFYWFVVARIKSFVMPDEQKTKKSFMALFKNNSPTSLNIHRFEDSDYDKHEHRSNRSLYKYNEYNEAYEKIPISYNNLISSYTLVNKLKQVQLIHKSKEEMYRFQIFPKLLRDVPIGNEKRHIYRENYRISGNDRVATKIMYRYKLNELTLKEFLNYLKEDDFMQEYKRYLENQKIEDEFNIATAITALEPDVSVEDESELTLYIVYSFVLKFDHIDKDDSDLYFYHISKDQFRVHYHINQLDFRESEEFEKKQEYLAKLVDIYFLKRLKRFKEIA